MPARDPGLSVTLRIVQAIDAAASDCLGGIAAALVAVRPINPSTTPRGRRMPANPQASVTWPQGNNSTSRVLALAL